jgi:hypothetical protein
VFRPRLLLLSLTLPQVRVPLGVNLRTAPLHGTDDAVAADEFGGPLSGLKLPGVHLKFKGISDIFSDTRVDSKHKHYP